MSELKAFESKRIYWSVEQVEREAGDIDSLHLDDNLFYIKSEADKVIADLEESHEKEVEQLILTIEQCKRAARTLRKKNEHSKYKRCLAMARWCKDKVDAIKNGYIVSSIESQHGVMTTCPPECNPKFSYYSRWQKRWLKIAERFKEAK